MKLVQNWKAIAARSHSMWAFYLSFFLLVLPELLYGFFGWDTNPRLWWLLAVAALAYGILGRLNDQGIERTKMHSPWFVGLAFLAMVIAVVVGGWSDGSVTGNSELSTDPQTEVVAEDEFMDLAVSFIGGWEGLRLEAYQDIVGVWTVCYGETKGVRPGDSYTKAGCDQMFAREIASYRAGYRSHLKPDTISALTVPREVSFVDLAYNVGVAGAGGSTATRRLNAGDISGACEALTWWNKAGGRVIRGLVNRRSAAFDLCMRGLV